MRYKKKDEVILVRGIPFLAEEIEEMQHKLDAQLFDESMFADDFAKQAYCANVLRALDTVLKQWQVKHNTRDLPEYIDIGDKLWFYIPVNLFPPEEEQGIDAIIVMPTKERPAGLVGWYRRRRVFSGFNGGH